MALRNGIDTVAFLSGGVYSETYGPTEKANIANLFAFYGLIEQAFPILAMVLFSFKERPIFAFKEMPEIFNFKIRPMFMFKEKTDAFIFKKRPTFRFEK